jgi:hypothetical protein
MITVGVVFGGTFIVCLFLLHPSMLNRFDDDMYKVFMVTAAVFCFSFAYATWRMK